MICNAIYRAPQCVDVLPPLYIWSERPCVAIWQQIQAVEAVFLQRHGAAREPGFIVVSLLQLLSLVEIGDTWYTSLLVKRVTHER